MKERIIKLLGGYTASDVRVSVDKARCESYSQGAEYGKCFAFREMKLFMDGLFGEQAEEWCDASYAFVKERVSEDEES